MNLLKIICVFLTIMMVSEGFLKPGKTKGSRGRKPGSKPKSRKDLRREEKKAKAKQVVENTAKTLLYGSVVGGSVTAMIDSITGMAADDIVEAGQAFGDAFQDFESRSEDQPILKPVVQVMKPLIKVLTDRIKSIESSVQNATVDIVENNQTSHHNDEVIKTLEADLKNAWANITQMKMDVYGWKLAANTSIGRLQDDLGDLENEVESNKAGDKDLEERVDVEEQVSKFGFGAVIMILVFYGGFINRKQFCSRAGSHQQHDQFQMVRQMVGPNSAGRTRVV